MKLGAGPTILLVEDNPDLRYVASRQLTRLGYQVVETGCSVAALQILERGAPAAVLFTDVMMPGELDGVALALTVRDRFPDIKILLTSGQPHPDGDEAGGRLPFPMLHKPYGRDELAEALHDLLHRGSDPGRQLSATNM